MDLERFTRSSPGTLVDAADALGRHGKAFLPNNLPPPDHFSTKAIRLALSAADQELTRLDGIAREIEQPELLFANHLRREAVLSSAIEGTHTTLADLILFEATRRERTRDDAHVENYVNALKYGRDRVNEVRMSRALFCELHALLMANTDADDTTPGRTRDCHVFIGHPTFQGARFVPPPHIFVDGLLDDLSEYLENENEAALIKLAVAHYQFEAIHPFRDGNGRIGRLMISLWLHKNRVLTSPMLYLSAYFVQNTTQYYDALLKVSTDNAWEEWVLYFLRGVQSQAHDTWKRTQRLSALRAEYKRRLLGPRAAVGPQRLVDDLFAIPAISVSDAMKSLDVTYAAAKATIEKLIVANILEPEPTRYAGRGYYFAKELMDVVDEPLPSDDGGGSV